ncbi:MAG: NAD(P)-binding domain-containing protein [Hyphomonadaceae bacterium]
MYDVAVIGAGPVGLAAGTRLAAAGQSFILLEAGDSAGASVRQWAHVRMFSPWDENIDPVASELLEATGWTRPVSGSPDGGELYECYLAPLAALEILRSAIHLNAEVVTVGRHRLDKTLTDRRAKTPFALTLQSGKQVLARHVIDASGTWRTPNPLGAGGYALPDEPQAPIVYGPPSSRGVQRNRYAGMRVLVVGAGHSAMNAVLDLLQLKAETGAGHVLWALRRDHLAKSDADADPLGERAALNAKARAALSSGDVEVLAPFAIHALRPTTAGVEVDGEGSTGTRTLNVDQIIAATGFRPNLAMTREVRLRIDPWLEAPEKLAVLIDPNENTSCNSPPVHGAEELSHPDYGYFIVGMKSYGRAPTFLLSTGYKQVASVIARIRGEPEPHKPSSCSQWTPCPR